MRLSSAASLCSPLRSSPSRRSFFPPEFLESSGISGNSGRLRPTLSFSLFPFVSRSNFPPLRAKVNRTDTRTVTRNFLGKERSDRNEEGNRVGIFSFLPEAHSSHRRRDVVTSSIDLFPKPMLSRSSSRALVKFHDAWHIISRQGVGGKMGRRTASFPKRLGLMGGREESQFRLGPRCVSLYFLARTIDAFDLAPSYYLYHAFRYPPEK